MAGTCHVWRATMQVQGYTEYREAGSPRDIEVNYSEDTEYRGASMGEKPQDGDGAGLAGILVQEGSARLDVDDGRKEEHT